MAETVLITVMVLMMVAAPPTFMIGLALREQRLRGRSAG